MTTFKIRKLIIIIQSHLKIRPGIVSTILHIHLVMVRVRAHVVLANDVLVPRRRLRVRALADLLNEVLVTRNVAIEAPQGRARSDLAAQDPGFEPPWQNSEALVLHEDASGDTEDVVELLESALLGLWHEQEQHAEGDDVETSVEAEKAGGAKDCQHTWEGDGEDSGPEQTGRDGPRHTDLSVGQREDLGGVGERNGSFTWAVEGAEDVDEKGYQSEMGSAALRDEQTQAGGQQSPGHLWEGEQQKCATAVGVDCPDGGPRKCKVNNTETEGRKESTSGTRAGLLENRARVKGDNVDTTHLLGKHDGERREGCATDAGNGEELGEARDVVAALGDKGLFHAQLSVDVVQVTSSLKLGITQALQRLVCICVTLLLDVPARGFCQERQ